MSRRIPAAILGATGYVGGELLRLLATHPVFELYAALSTSRAGEPVGSCFPTLAAALPDARFHDLDDASALFAGLDELALFSAAPHGASAAHVAALLEVAAVHGTTVHCVDASADFRYPDAAAYEAVYGQAHGAPALLKEFHQGLPEFVDAVTKPHAGHPGCFATATMLAAVPLCAAVPGLAVYVNAITGSTGSGRSPLPGTHHPERHGNLYAYKPLTHRHVPEITAAIAATGGGEVQVGFVPHSGPFARGIHVTLQATLPEAITTDELRKIYDDAYREHEFVRVVDGTPRIKDVVTGNYCHIGVAADGNNVVVMSAIDNLVKGAAGGAVQWMNRLWSLPESCGLQGVAPAWT